MILKHYMNLEHIFVCVFNEVEYLLNFIIKKISEYTN